MKSLSEEPVKNHNFDVVNFGNKITIACKQYDWDETGNVPRAAKMDLQTRLFSTFYFAG